MTAIAWNDLGMSKCRKMADEKIMSSVAERTMATILVIGMNGIFTRKHLGLISYVCDINHQYKHRISITGSRYIKESTLAVKMENLRTYLTALWAKGYMFREDSPGRSILGQYVANYDNVSHEAVFASLDDESLKTIFAVCNHIREESEWWLLTLIRHSSYWDSLDVGDDMHMWEVVESIKDDELLFV